jgi:environmental stress-induced protein Ves
MSLQIIDAEQIQPQPWRNGGGTTRPLLKWPAGPDRERERGWEVRISLAEIAADGPFSSFEGVERWFAVVSGAGVALQFDDGEQRLVPGDPPLRFDGGAAPNCRLLGGATGDINLMLRNGRGVLQSVVPGVAWSEAFAMRGLFVSVAGDWSGGAERRSLPAMTLLWSGAETAGDETGWTFEPDDTGTTTVAWWLGFTPNTPVGR